MRFVVYYTREPHAQQMAFRDINQPKTYEERTALAHKTCEELRLDVDTWVDDLGDTTRALFGDLPDPAIVLDAEGKVVLKLPWCDPDVLAKAIPEMLAEQPKNPTPPADRGFLTAIAVPPPAAHDDPHARHHREVMLAWLVTHSPTNPDRTRWLDELAKDAPPHQQAWVEQQRKADVPADRRQPASRDHAPK